MFFSRFDQGLRVLNEACKAGGIHLDRGHIIGSPERLNLFTLEGDILRLDLELNWALPFVPPLFWWWKRCLEDYIGAHVGQSLSNRLHAVARRL